MLDPDAMAIRIANHLIVPFGSLSCESHQLRVAGSSPHELLLESESPCIHIDRGADRPVTLGQVQTSIPGAALKTSVHADAHDYLHGLCDVLRDNCELQGSHEHLFLVLYFEQLAQMFIDETSVSADNSSINVLLANVLMPIPKAHLYLPERGRRHSDSSQRNCKMIDFAFWTGRRFLAVFVDDGVPKQTCVGDEKLLRSWGIETFRIIAEQLQTQGLTEFWPSFRDAQLFDIADGLGRYRK